MKENGNYPGASSYDISGFTLLSDTEHFNFSSLTSSFFFPNNPFSNPTDNTGFAHSNNGMYLNPEFWGNQDHNFNNILPNYSFSNLFMFSLNPEFWENQENYHSINFKFNYPLHIDPITGYVWPTISTRLTNKFDNVKHPFGIDVGAYFLGFRGEPIFSPVNGEIITAGIPDWSESKIPYVVIKGDDGYEHRLAHVAIPYTTKVGNIVKAGEVVALMSDIGSEKDGVHLHYDVVYTDAYGIIQGRINPQHLFLGIDFTIDM